MRGRMERMTDEQAIEWAIDNPPEDTRAYFRGRCLRQYADAVAAASWDSVIFDVPVASRCSGCPRSSPCAGRRRTSARCSTACRTAGDLVAALTQQG